MKKIEQALDIARSGVDGQQFDYRYQAPGVSLGGYATAEGDAMDLVVSRTSVTDLDRQKLESEKLCAFTGSQGAESFKVVRTQVLRALAKNQWNSLAVVSPGRGDGNSTVALNLSFSISQDRNYTALAVDFDLRKPSHYEKLGLLREAGVERYFEEGIDAVGDLMLSVHDPRFAVLPCLSPVENSSEVLSSRRCARLVRELKGRYPDRIVVFDLPPVLAGDDVLAFLPQVDAILLVVGEGTTNKSQLLATRQVIGDAPVVGVVLNRARNTVLIS